MNLHTSGPLTHFSQTTHYLAFLTHLTFYGLCAQFYNVINYFYLDF